MINEFYDELDKLFSIIKEVLDNYGNSEILQKHFLKIFESFFYANLINNFFLNLNTENIEECGLSSDYIVKIKRKYKKIRKDVESALSKTLERQLIDEVFYENFKAQVKKDFPNALKLVSEIEREIDIERSKGYLKNKAEEIKKTGKSERDFDSFLITKALEAYINQNKCFPRAEDLDKLLNVLGKEVLPKISEIVTERLKKNAEEILKEHREDREGFEERLYERWKEPLDLLEYLIMISIESGQVHQSKLILAANESDKFKFEALIQIHARACQISNEILILLKAGCADGANARWRTLYELVVISFFLLDNDDEVSKRYLKHETVRKFKDAKDYRDHYEQLGFASIEEQEFEEIKKEKERLCKKYNDRFNKDWGWIPSSLSDQNFRALAEHVGLGHLLPFYNLSAATIHGLSRGLYRLGLMPDSQSKLLLCGSTNYGLADPLQNTSISLYQITLCLLDLQPDFASFVQMRVMDSFVDEIGYKAVNVQKDIEKEESSKSK